MNRTTAATDKTAAVRDLRNHFAAVAKWIEDGERVTITRNGTPFAILAPVDPELPREVDWSARFKRRPPIATKRKLTAQETAALYEQMRRDF